MINLKHIFLILLICHGSATLGYSAPTTLKTQLQSTERVEKTEKKDFLFDNQAIPVDSVLKNAKRSSISIRLTNGGSAYFNKLYRSVTLFLQPVKLEIVTAADRIVDQYLMHNYPSHNFW